MKDIKKLLAESRSEALPDERIKDNIKADLGYCSPSPALSYAHGGTEVKKRNTVIALTAAALALILFLAIVLPIALKKDGDKFSGITDANSFYAYGAASVGSILAADENGAASAFGKVLTETTPDTTDVDRYISLIEGLLSDSEIKSESVAGAEGYEFGMTVKYLNLEGGSVSYSMYYDKIFLKGGHDGDERESSYAIIGVLHAGGGVYPVDGTYETETDKDEQECELEFKAYTDADKKSYIEVKRESETEDGGAEQEYEYVYSVYERGRLTEKTKIKYETEDGETDLELEIEKDGKTQKLSFKAEASGGAAVLAGKGEIDGKKVKFRVYEVDGKKRYEFYD